MFTSSKYDDIILKIGKNMVYLVLANLLICICCLYLLNWSEFFRNKNYKVKFLLFFILFANIPFINLFLLTYLLLNKEDV